MRACMTFPATDTVYEVTVPNVVAVPVTTSVNVTDREDGNVTVCATGATVSVVFAVPSYTRSSRQCSTPCSPVRFDSTSVFGAVDPVMTACNGTGLNTGPSSRVSEINRANDENDALRRHTVGSVTPFVAVVSTSPKCAPNSVALSDWSNSSYMQTRIPRRTASQTPRGWYTAVTFSGTDDDDCEG